MADRGAPSRRGHYLSSTAEVDRDGRAPRDPSQPDPIGGAALLKPDAVAEMLGLGSARTLADWRARGCGPRYVTISRSIVRYRADDVAAFVRARLSPEGITK